MINKEFLLPEKSHNFSKSIKLVSVLSLLFTYYFNQGDFNPLLWFQNKQEFTTRIKIESIQAKSLFIYEIGNTGTKTLSLKLKAKHRRSPVALKNIEIFKLYSNSNDSNKTDIELEKSHYANVVAGEIVNLKTGDGIRLFFQSGSLLPVDWSGFTVEVHSILGDSKHRQNQSPYWLVGQRFCSVLAFLLLIFFSRFWWLAIFRPVFKIIFPD